MLNLLVKILNAIVANTAVRSFRWPHNFTCLTMSVIIDMGRRAALAAIIIVDGLCASCYRISVDNSWVGKLGLKGLNLDQNS